MAKKCCSIDDKLNLVEVKPHVHQYDADGNQLCCVKSTKIYENAGAGDLLKNSRSKKEKHNHEHAHAHHHDHDDHDHSHDIEGKSMLQLFSPAAVSFVLLMIAISFDYLIPQAWFTGWVRLAWYIVAYIPVGVPVLREAVESILYKDFFSEFFLMGIATIGAFAIGEYPEAVAVMLFYSVGEIFQTLAVSKAKGNIQALVDQRPEMVTVLREDEPLLIPAEEVLIGDIIQLKPGEKLGLDGILISETASFETSALTGESKPTTKKRSEAVLAGMINLNTLSQVKVTAAFEDSKLSRILELVQEATTHKAPTELFIRKFSKIYTPIVVYLALGITFLPAILVQEYIFSEWLYRALIFLVISCPCALVISIPLGYFGGIGAASRNGILFKGSNYLDVLAKVEHVVVDKTGTLTEGVFQVQELYLQPGFDREQILNLVNTLESHSTHPVATAIHNYVGEVDHSVHFEQVEELFGHGLKAQYKGDELLVGNFKLLDKMGVKYPQEAANHVYTLIAIAWKGEYVGYLTISDQLKPDADVAVEKLHKLGVKTTMLSGDKDSVVQYVAREIAVQNAYGDLLPEDKVNHLKTIKSSNESVAFVGDGVNDAPVIALSDVGMAMGGLGSDAAIEIADVVIQDDMPSKIPMAIRIGKETRKIVFQNISFAFGVKLIVLLLGAGGIATMWEAVFADVGVALLAILNAVRIQRMKF